MKPLQQLSIQDYVEVALRRKWILILPAVIIFVGGLVFSYRLPALYRASTLILVQQQRVPAEYVKPTVNAGIEERLQTISQEILSRTRLETIINELNLYPELRQSVFMEEVIEKMRKDITLEVKGKDAFQLFYQGKDPQTVARVADRLASLFIEQNLKMREDLAEGTTEFLDRELSRVKATLVEQEEAVREFKAANMGALPEQLDANLRTLEQLQLQLQMVATSLQNARERQITVQNQIAQFSNMEEQLGEDLVQVDTSSEGGASVDELKMRLEELQARYKDKHPEVLRLKSQIKRAEEEIQRQSEEPATLEAETATDGTDQEFSFADTMGLELTGMNQEIGRLVAEQAKITEKIALYQTRIEETPKKEQELLSLQRDYFNTQKNYESLLDKRLNAQIAANMEKMQKGERFRILDPAEVPQKPFKPNRGRIALLSLLLGLAVGAGLCVGMEYLDHSFRDIDDLEHYLKLPVLASIPTITAEEGKKTTPLKKRLRFGGFGVLVIVAAVIIVQIFVFDVSALVLRFN